MKKAVFFILFLFNPLNACEYFFNLKKAGIILESNARLLSNPPNYLFNKLVLCAESSLQIYFAEYVQACDECQKWSNNEHYVYVMILEQYIKQQGL